MKHLLLTLCFVLCTGANESSSKYEAHPLAGVALTRTKRSVLQFGAMILCKVKRYPIDYNGYGCWCGTGGKGRPLDAIDRCCYVHDKCYDALVRKRICRRSTLLITFYKRKGCTGCASRFWNPFRCQREKCKCDSAAARCFKKYNSRFNERLKYFSQSRC